MRMLIVVEGPDNAGKSTLVERLRRTAPRDVRFVSMLGGRTEGAEAQRKRTYETMNTVGDHRVTVCERFHPISDAVYRALYGGQPAFSRFETDSLFERLGLMRGRVVYCRPPLSFALQSAMTAKGDDDPEWVERVSRTLPDLYLAYDALMFDLSWRCAVPVVRYDHTEPALATRAEAMICAA